MCASEETENREVSMVQKIYEVKVDDHLNQWSSTLFVHPMLCRNFAWKSLRNYDFIALSGNIVWFWKYFGANKNKRAIYSS